MSNYFSRETILAGNAAKRRIESMDPTYSRFNGEANVEGGGEGLDYTTPPNNMGGTRGAFAMKVMNDPQPVMQFENEFNQSNEGYEFNQAKMMQGYPLTPWG